MTTKLPVRMTKKFWGAYGALYGKGVTEEPKATTRSRSKTEKQKCAPEGHEQNKFIAWLRQHGVLHYAIPNGGRRNAIEGAKFKREGVSRGAPDVCIPIPFDGLPGLYIEMKKKWGGKLSVEQVWWGEQLRKNGYRWEEAKGCEVAIGYVMDYFKNKLPEPVFHPDFIF